MKFYAVEQYRKKSIKFPENLTGPVLSEESNGFTRDYLTIQIPTHLAAVLKNLPEFTRRKIFRHLFAFLQTNSVSLDSTVFWQCGNFNSDS